MRILSRLGTTLRSSKLGAKQKREIERKANRLLELCGCLRWPPPIRLNLPLTYLRFSIEYSDDIPCPAVERDFAPTIHLPSGLSETRKRFIIAHEMGHQYLGHPKKTGEVADTPHQCREACYFAAVFLMPKDMFVEEWKSEDKAWDCHLARVVWKFAVSLTAATIRAEELGLVPKNRCWFCEERKKRIKCPL